MHGLGIQKIEICQAKGKYLVADAWEGGDEIVRHWNLK